MTLNEMTTVLAEKMKRSSDIPFRLLLAERIQVWRSRLIANAIQKNSLQRKFFKQTLYMPMEVKNSVPCTVLVNCEVSVSIKPIPQLIRQGTTLFDYIGGVDGRSPFMEVTPGAGNYLDTGRFAKMFPKFELWNQSVVAHKKDLPMLRIEGIFDDPLAVLQCNCDCDGTEDCDTWNMEYPVSGEIGQLIIQSIETIDYPTNPNLQPTEDK